MVIASKLMHILICMFLSMYVCGGGGGGSISSRSSSSSSSVVVAVLVAVEL